MPIDPDAITRREALGACAAFAMTPFWKLPPPSESPYEACARDAARWLRAQPMQTGAGKAWPAIPGKRETMTVDIYSGTAGVLLFLAEAARRWPELELKEDARQAGKEILSWIPEMAERRFMGLYTGVSGMLWALAESHVRGIADPAWTEGKAPQLPTLHAQDLARHRTPSSTNDVVSGLAGLGLAFLEAPLLRDRKLAIASAAGLGDLLLERARPEGEGLRWALEENLARNMPNFSHGTAGVAFFLSKLYTRTKHKPYLEAALKGAGYLLGVADKQEDGCLIFHADPDGLSRYYLGWCHGPAGTSQLWWQLAKATGDRKWSEWARRGAKSLLDLNVPEQRHEGYWNNEGLCCGTAGIGRFFLDMYRRTRDKTYLQAAERCARALLERAVRDEQGAHWPHAEHRVKPAEVAAQTGWMQGAAGIAAFLLEMASPRRAVFRLPVDADV
jgi:lantibiotic modifying enzyme